MHWPACGCPLAPSASPGLRVAGAWPGRPAAPPSKRAALVGPPRPGAASVSRDPVVPRVRSSPSNPPGFEGDPRSPWKLLPEISPPGCPRSREAEAASSAQEAGGPFAASLPLTRRPSGRLSVPRGRGCPPRPGVARASTLGLRVAAGRPPKLRQTGGGPKGPPLAGGWRLCRPTAGFSASSGPPLAPSSSSIERVLPSFSPSLCAAAAPPSRLLIGYRDFSMDRQNGKREEEEEEEEQSDAAAESSAS